MSEERLADGFKVIVRDWLNEDLRNAADIVSVSSYGTDWAGDTVGGFYGETELTIRYVTVDGDLKTEYVGSGERLGALWSRLVRAWPA